VTDTAASAERATSSAVSRSVLGGVRGAIAGSTRAGDPSGQPQESKQVGADGGQILSVVGDNIATMTASAHDVAAALRERLPGIGVKKLHKLLYYAQGCHVASLSRPLFSESIRAWDMGPVVAELWRDEDRGEPLPEPHKLGEAELNTVGYVASRYGRLSGNQLERLTHTEQPWQAGDARRKVGDSDRIELEWIRNHFVAEAANDADEEGGLDPTVISASLVETHVPADAGRLDDVEAVLAKLGRA
jgi:uncharacterized phage-associated protein